MIPNSLQNRLVAASETPSLDAQVLLAHILGKSRSWVLAHPEAQLSPEQEQRLEQAMKRLEAGEPLPYVLGHWEFFGLDFTLTPAVLIPRPETELLVEGALAWLRAHPNRRNVLDVGTGSGCIAVALARQVPDLRLEAVDISGAALEIARQNAARHGVGRRITFIQSELVTPIGDPYDLICANLPYIPSVKLRALKVAQFEPGLALDGGLDGMHLIRRLLQIAPYRLGAGGTLLLEIEATQGNAARTAARAAFPQASVEVLRDLAGCARVVKVEDT